MQIEDRTIAAFLEDIASTAVVPAGGSAAAVVGATGAALCEMACIHTLTGGEATDDRTELTSVGDDLARQRSTLVALANRDAAAVEAFVDDSAEGPSTSALKQATGVPLAIAEACLTVIEDATVATAAGHSNVVPDAVIGAYLARGALDASVYIVRANLRDISDASFVETMERRATAVETDAQTAFSHVQSNASPPN